MRSVKIVLLLLSISTCFADSIFRGNYFCTVIGKNSVSDSKGNTVTYISGNLIIDRNDKVTLKARANFKLNTGVDENRNISGSGKLGKIKTTGIFRKSELNFKVTENISKIVAPTRVSLLGTRLLGRTTKSATIVVRTPYGIVPLACR